MMSERPLYEPLSPADKDSVTQVLNDLKRLKPDYYVVVRIFLNKHGIYHGFYKDIGEVLGLHPTTVKYRLTKGLEWMAERMMTKARNKWVER